MIRAASLSEIPLSRDRVWRDLAATGVEVLLDFRLAGVTTMRLGGTTSALLRPCDLPGLVRVLKVLDRHSVDYRVLGCGSNLVVATAHLSSVVVHTRRIDWLVPEPGGIRCGGGTSLVMTIK
jgi:UDP-N-acetylenolpyruvoylglucosamine reductase